MQGGKGQCWGYLVPKDRLSEKYDKIKVLESLSKSRISGKIGQKRVSARVGDQFLLGLGKWSQYLQVLK